MVTMEDAWELGSIKNNERTCGLEPEEAYWTFAQFISIPYSTFLAGAREAVSFHQQGQSSFCSSQFTIPCLYFQLTHLYERLISSLCGTAGGLQVLRRHPPRALGHGLPSPSFVWALGCRQEQVCRQEGPRTDARSIWKDTGLGSSTWPHYWPP